MDLLLDIYWHIFFGPWARWKKSNLSCSSWNFQNGTAFRIRDSSAWSPHLKDRGGDDLSSTFQCEEHACYHAWFAYILAKPLCSWKQGILLFQSSSQRCFIWAFVEKKPMASSKAPHRVSLETVILASWHYPQPDVAGWPTANSPEWFHTHFSFTHFLIFPHSSLLDILDKKKAKLSWLDGLIFPTLCWLQSQPQSSFLLQSHSNLFVSSIQKVFY